MKMEAPTDQFMLSALSMRDDGISIVEIAERLETTKGVISGLLFRIDRALADSEAET